MPEIQAYRFGQMTVDGQRYTADLILLPGGILPNWWRQAGHRLATEDLAAVLNPEAGVRVLVIGTGAYGMMKVPPETVTAIEAAGIDVRIVPTGRAWRVYNDLCARRPQATAGAFHLTC